MTIEASGMSDSQREFAIQFMKRGGDQKPPNHLVGHTYSTAEVLKIMGLTYEGLKVWRKRTDVKPLRFWKTAYYTQEMLDALLDIRESQTHVNLSRPQLPHFSSDPGEVNALFLMNFDALTDYQFDVISFKYGLIDGIRRTHKEVAEDLGKGSGYDPSGIGQAEKKALRRMEASGSTLPKFENMKAIREFIKNLPPDKKVLFRLRYTRGISFAEIAEVMGIDVKSILALHKQVLLEVSTLEENVG